MPVHGGLLRQAARRYGIPVADWLDLSTGINPWVWPVPALPSNVWRRLPEDEDGLVDRARAYYGAPQALPVDGSQAAIQALPRLRRSDRVAVLAPAYAEHARAWACAGHAVLPVSPQSVPVYVDAVDVLVLINPNNPTGYRFPPDLLLRWHQQLAARGGWLVVDEAFMDPTPLESLAVHATQPGLIVLRSLGKFFGLAGARVGFVLAEPKLLAPLAHILGPWIVAGPSRAVASQALADAGWQRATRARLLKAEARMVRLLAASGLPSAGGCALFQWVQTPRAHAIHEALARQGILTRLFLDPPSLRFGLPDTEHAWTRLQTALGRVMASGTEARSP